jgi:hypothetical protein
MRRGPSPKSIVVWSILAIVALLFAVLSVSAGYRYYSVWSQRKAGQARLAEAEHSRQIAVEEARAKRAAATELAAAEVERAKGVAEANRIIGESLEGNEAYLRYLWIQGLHDGHGETIYIPTEANIPILEATRRGKSAETK